MRKQSPDVKPVNHHSIKHLNTMFQHLIEAEFEASRTEATCNETSESDCPLGTSKSNSIEGPESVICLGFCDRLFKYLFRSTQPKILND